MYVINIMQILVGKKLYHRRNASKNLKEGFFFAFPKYRFNGQLVKNAI